MQDVPTWATRADDQRAAGDVRTAAADEAFGQLYDRYAPELMPYCRRMLGSSHDAEDALQATFLKAYRALEAGDGPVLMRPWLYTVARNECLSMIRQRGRSKPLAAASEPAGPCVASEVERREEVGATLADVSNLPGEQREALLRTSLGSASGEQVASALDTDRERVKALVFRARRSLGASREARDTSCAEIREQLTVLSGGSLRRRVLREHLLACEGCRAFRAELRGGLRGDVARPVYDAGSRSESALAAHGRN